MPQQAVKPAGEAYLMKPWSMMPAPKTSLPPVSILILAGGRATRMHGLNKGLQHLHGHSLVARLLAQLHAQAWPVRLDDLMISANHAQANYQQQFPAARIIGDPWPDYRGPLAGMFSGLQQARHPCLLVVPCDLFLLPATLLSALRQRLLSQSLDAVYASMNGQAIYPLCLLHKRVLASLELQLINQQYAVRHWLFSQRTDTVNFTLPPEIVMNINTLEQLETAARFVQQANRYLAAAGLIPWSTMPCLQDPS